MLAPYIYKLDVAFFFFVPAKKEVCFKREKNSLETENLLRTISAVMQNIRRNCFFKLDVGRSTETLILTCFLFVIEISTSSNFKARKRRFEKNKQTLSFSGYFLYEIITLSLLLSNIITL